MKLIFDGAKIKSNEYNKKAMEIEKIEKCSLSSAFSMVGDAFEKKSKIFRVKGIKNKNKEVPMISVL